MLYLNKKIQKLSEYPFDRLRKLLTNINKKNFVDLSIGQPYHNTPNFVKDIIYSQKNNWNLYPPLSGTNELNNSYLNWLERSFGVSRYFDEKNILPLSGTKEGLFSISMALNARKICPLLCQNICAFPRRIRSDC